MQLPLPPNDEPLPFRDAHGKTIIFKDMDLAKECAEWVAAQNTPEQEDLIKASGYNPAPAVAIMKQGTWDAFQREGGRWVYCESLEQLQEICREVHRRVQLEREYPNRN